MELQRAVWQVVEWLKDVGKSLLVGGLLLGGVFGILYLGITFAPLATVIIVFTGGSFFLGLIIRKLR